PRRSTAPEPPHELRAVLPQHQRTGSYQRVLSGVWLSTCLGTRPRQEVGPAGCHTSSFTTLRLCVAASHKEGGSQCSEMSLFSFLPRWRLRFCGGAPDSRYVGGVDHA